MLAETGLSPITTARGIKSIPPVMTVAFFSTPGARHPKGIKRRGDLARQDSISHEWSVTSIRAPQPAVQPFHIRGS